MKTAFWRAKIRAVSLTPDAQCTATTDNFFKYSYFRDTFTSYFWDTFTEPGQLRKL